MTTFEVKANKVNVDLDNKRKMARLQEIADDPGTTLGELATAISDLARYIYFNLAHEEP